MRSACTIAAQFSANDSVSASSPSRTSPTVGPSDHETVCGGLTGKSNARETTGLRDSAKSISTISRTTDVLSNRPGEWYNTRDSGANSSVAVAEPASRRRKISVVLLSTKLTLIQDRAVKQIICKHKKLGIRGFPSGW